MIEDVYEPLAKYRDEFKAKFYKISNDTFEDFVLKSGVDISANRKTVAEINKKKKQKNSLENKKTFVSCLFFLLCVIIIAALGYGIYILVEEVNKHHLAITLPVFLLSIGLSIMLFRKMRNLETQIAHLAEQISDLIAAAWKQMTQLNKLFNWETLTGMVTKCVPRFEFDPIFRKSRIAELEQLFGWNSSFNNDKSILFAHSGEINGNPFVIAKFRRQVWGSKIYTGTKEITYTVTVKGADGKYHREIRHQTLVATVEKPIPEYIDDNMVIYGNDAAPNLDFSRVPSAHSGKSGFFNDFFKKREQKKLEKFARNLTDDSDFTMMSNKEFEVLFHADDRNDEIEFRLLFTPLAQAQMVSLLNDTQEGYGDDFSFVKREKISMISPEHLQIDDLDVDPEQFKDYSFDNVKAYFIKRSNAFFKSFYFAMAPLLTIPLYQQTRTREHIYGITGSDRVSFWENESFVNYLGEGKFEHPKCITNNILKTTDSTDADGGAVNVTAYGFSGTDRVDWVPVYGNDGKMHNVPVKWVEYNPVNKTTTINIGIASSEEASNNTRSIRRRIYWYS